MFLVLFHAPNRLYLNKFSGVQELLKVKRHLTFEWRSCVFYFTIQYNTWLV